MFSRANGNSSSTEGTERPGNPWLFPGGVSAAIQELGNA